MKCSPFVLCLWITVFCLPFQKTAQAQTPSRELPEPPRPAWMETDANLHTPVALAISRQPLRVVLSSLSAKSGVSIRAERGLQEYRVSLHVTGQPLGKIMGRLQDLFGHGHLPNTRYQWNRIERSGTPPAYVLERFRRAYEEEAQAFAAPRTTLARWLKEIRQYARLTPEQRKAFQSDCPLLKSVAINGESLTEGVMQPVGEAMLALTDAQSEALLQTEKVDLPQLTLSDAAVDYLQRAVPPGSGVTADFEDYTRPSQAELSLESDKRQGMSGLFSVRLHFRAGFPRYCPYSIALDTLGQLPGATDDDEKFEPSKEEPNTVIDLLAHENAPPGKLAKLSPAKALALFARETKCTLYAEIFLKPPITLFTTKGKPEYLLSEICKTCGYRWRKIGGDYLVYSKAWAQDRAADVPQPLLDRWAAHYAKQERYDLTDLIEMACLRDEQLHTLALMLGINSPLLPQNRNALCLAGTLHSAQRQAAFRPEGVALGSLDQAHLRIIQQVFERENIVAPIRIRFRKVWYKGILTGTEIQFADQIGPAKYDGWAFELLKLPDREVPP